jgi:phage replication O-like protein O
MVLKTYSGGSGLRGSNKMANPQKENGFTPIANEIMEKVFSSDFSSTQLKIVLLVLRYTYGFSRKKAEMSVAFITKAINVGSRQTQRELTKLIKQKVIKIEEKEIGTKSRVISFNKDYDTWLIDCDVSRDVINDSGQNDNGLDDSNRDGLNDIPRGGLNDTQERKKEKKKYIYSFSGESHPPYSSTGPPTKRLYTDVVEYLNLRAGSFFRSTTKSTQALIRARENDGYTLEDFKMVIDIKSGQWLDDPKQSKYLRPETLFGNKFEGYLNEAKRGQPKQAGVTVGPSVVQL